MLKLNLKIFFIDLGWFKFLKFVVSEFPLENTNTVKSIGALLGNLSFKTATYCFLEVPNIYHWRRPTMFDPVWFVCAKWSVRKGERKFLKKSTTRRFTLLSTERDFCATLSAACLCCSAALVVFDIAQPCRYFLPVFILCAFCVWLVFIMVCASDIDTVWELCGASFTQSVGFRSSLNIKLKTVKNVWMQGFWS